MGRKRVIDQQAILDAAERVIARDGATRLTLDAVAIEAGISKAAVLYDHKTKQAVVHALIDRATERDVQHHARHEALAAPTTSPVHGRVRAAQAAPSESFKPVALNLVAAMALDAELRRRMRDRQAETIGRILEESASPRSALLAYLALEGLKFLENLDFYQFAEDERGRVLKEIGLLADLDLPPSE